MLQCYTVIVGQRPIVESPSSSGQVSLDIKVMLSDAPILIEFSNA